MEIKPLKALIFETTSICNLSCKMCFINEIKRNPPILSLELFKKIMDNTPQLERVSLNNWGEPLLNKNIFDMVKYAKSKGVKDVIFTTNGTLLNHESIAEIINSGLDVIEFSVDGDEESYKTIRNFDYAQIVNNIEKLIELRNKSGSKLQIAIKMVIDEYTENKVDFLNKQWKEKVDYIKLIPRIFHEERERTTFCKELTGSYNGRLVVLSNGNVVPCCVDYKGLLCIGNADKTPNLEILWNNAEMNTLRKEQSSGKFRPPCDKCVEYSSDNAEKRYE